ncbi:hypothetical protein KY495_09845 [Massilia sp. PAMC28688]|uniref:hypothetical protein n=1 Tax=Massilia sp. PAMC28688 TaxID=2861283 RepID=UPI001C638198|nr:hypothetical protein [Massilia sp. PAMC28688]QYF95421.1 hypothetical protein KY495_09845 [Massilia sp. PAMC28688]
MIVMPHAEGKPSSSSRTYSHMEGQVSHPYLKIFVEPSRSALVFQHVKDPFNDPMEVDMNLSNLDAAGFDQASRDIGGVVLGLMSLWYKDELSRHAGLKTPYDSSSDVDLIMSLVSKSVVGRTSIFIPAIDRLVAELARQDPDFARNNFMEAWPATRAKIEAYPD